MDSDLGSANGSFSFDLDKCFKMAIESSPLAIVNYLIQEHLPRNHGGSLIR